MTLCASGHLVTFQAASDEVFVLGFFGSSPRTWQVAVRLTKIHLFSFIVSHFPQDGESCNYRSAGRAASAKAAAEEAAKSTRNIPKTQENKKNGAQKNVVTLRSTAKSCFFFSESEFYLLFTAQGVFIILLTCRVDCNFYCRTSANT